MLRSENAPLSQRGLKTRRMFLGKATRIHSGVSMTAHAAGMYAVRVFEFGGHYLGGGNTNSVSTELAHDILEGLLVFLEQSRKLFIIVLEIHILLNECGIHSF